MFLVFNKQKIYSYMIALATVIILFCGANFFKIDDLSVVQTVAETRKNVTNLFCRDRRKKCSTNN